MKITDYIINNPSDTVNRILPYRSNAQPLEFNDIPNQIGARISLPFGYNRVVNISRVPNGQFLRRNLKSKGGTKQYEEFVKDGTLELVGLRVHTELDPNSELTGWTRSKTTVGLLVPIYALDNVSAQSPVLLASILEFDEDKGTDALGLYSEEPYRPIVEDTLRAAATWFQMTPVSTPYWLTTTTRFNRSGHLEFGAMEYSQE